MKHLALFSLLFALAAVACSEDSKGDNDAGTDLDTGSTSDSDADTDSDTGDGPTYQDLCDELHELCDGINIYAVQTCDDHLEPCSEFFGEMFQVEQLTDCFDAYEDCGELIDCVDAATVDPSPCEEAAVDCSEFTSTIDNDDEVVEAVIAHWPCWTEIGVDNQTDVINIWIAAKGVCVPSQEIYDTLCP